MSRMVMVIVLKRLVSMRIDKNDVVKLHADDEILADPKLNC